MEFYDLAFIKNALRMFDRASDKGWHERNGGNYSYRLDKSESELIERFVNDDRHFVLSIPAPEVAGEYFLFTVSGSFFADISSDPAALLCVIRIDGDGNGYRVVVGDGIHKPTSEIHCHLLSHSVSYAKAADRVVYHCHPSHLIASSFVLPMDDGIVSRTLWRSISEAALVFPEGLGALRWMIPGSTDLASATAKKLKIRRIVLWAHHGILACGKTAGDVYSLIDTAEKAAEIFMLYSPQKPLSFIKDGELVAECEAYGLHLDTSIFE